MVVYEGPKNFSIVTTASIIGEDQARELAWAEKHVRKDAHLSWILGNFVMADVANDNGHIFPLEDLKVYKETIPNKPLNMLHAPQHIVGHYVAEEMIFPTGEISGKLDVPYVETLAAFYKYYFPSDFEKVDAAFKEGSLFFSMEAIPHKLFCAAEGCGQEFDYVGRQDESYCDHLQQPAALRELRQPHFTGGALIIPPVRPGWKRADVKELSHLFENNEPLYNELAQSAPELSPTQWEQIMASILESAGEFDRVSL